MKSIRELNLNNKKVILRLDLNVPIKDGNILDDTKIVESIETIKYILDKNANILIMSHLGKIKSEDDKKDNTLLPIKKVLEKLLEIDINFVNEMKGKVLEESFNNNRITLMENTRYLDIPNKLESNCDLELAKYWASLGDVFINDAFGTSHRKHASNYGISRYIESGYGFLIEKEIKGLDPVVNNIKKPFVVIMGGAKVDDKIKLIENMLLVCDYLLVGGGIANTFLMASGYNVGSSLVSEDYIDNIKKLLKKYPDKIIMPIDTVVLDNEDVFVKDINNISSSTIYDIGPKTTKKYLNIINKANTIFLNGTMGMYEDSRFKDGTKATLKSIKNSKAIKVAGGGDALSSIKKFNYDKYFDYLSTGGGATLEYIINKKLNCFDGDYDIGS